MVSTPAVAGMMRLARQMTGSVLFGSHHENALSADSLKRFRVRAQILMALYPKAERPYLFGLHQCSRERAWIVPRVIENCDPRVPKASRTFADEALDRLGFHGWMCTEGDQKIEALGTATEQLI